MKKQDYNEQNFEVKHVLEALGKSGYVLRSRDDYNKDTFLDEGVVLRFVKNTQPQEWEKFKRQYPQDTEKQFCKNLSSQVEKYGTLDILRNGFKDRGAKFQLAYFRPFTKLNPEHERLYQQNTFSVINQFEYSKENPKTLDLVLFLNGLPITSAELKNHLTGQNYTDAIHQYQYDRNPKEPFFKKCFSHFSVDNDKVFFTTKLKGPQTEFLPFNRGLVNPEDPRGFKVCYLYRDIWHPDSLLEIISRFIQIIEVGGEKKTIFPRYQQLIAVRSLIKAAKENKAGKNYLIQHSAGSGKTFTISWLAHQLSQIHNQQDKRIFDSVVVISDRRVIDRQLREAVQSFEKKTGIVGTAEISKDLKKFLESRKNIIITTVQKFPFVVDELQKLERKTFAVLIDEAHSSQGGELSKKLKQTLSQPLTEEEEEKIIKENIEDKVLKDIRSRGRLPNVSFFAFTATPKRETLELFGEEQDDGSYHAFSVYSMNQAIKEGFILDVLENYMTYNTYFKLVKTITEDPEYDKKKATALLQRYTNLHQEAIKKKTSIMLDHFFHQVQGKIGGKATAMVVTRSRKAAVRYKLEFDKQLKGRGANFKALVAFTGTVEDGGIKYTETGMNDLPGSQIRKKFGTDQYRILIVAYKFQTGFNQPLLQTMYVDKRLQGLAAVQSLSRLNRNMKGKDHVFILDFVNEPVFIQEAFQKYYQTTMIPEGTDPNLLYELEKKVRDFNIVVQEEVEEFIRIWYTSADQSKLHKALSGAVARFQDLLEKEENEEEVKRKQKEFKNLLRKFVRLYAFIAQVVTFEDPKLEKLYLYCRFLLKKLPLTRESLPREILDAVDMNRFQIEDGFSGRIPLRAEDSELPAISAEPQKAYKSEKARLSEIINQLNEVFGGIFTEAETGKIEELSEQIQIDQELKDSISAGNPPRSLKLLFNDLFEDKLVRIYERDFGFFKKIEDNPEVKERIKDLLFDHALEYTQSKSE